MQQPAPAAAEESMEMLPPNALRTSGSMPLPAATTPQSAAAEQPQTLPAPRSQPSQAAPSAAETEQGSLRELLQDPQQQPQSAEPGRQSAEPAPRAAQPSDPPAMSLPQQESNRAAAGKPSESEPAAEPPGTPSPSDRPADDEFRFPENPFDQMRGQPQGRDSRADAGMLPPRDTSMIMANELSCEDFRERIARDTIETVSLDPSPPFRPDLFDPQDYRKQREKFEQRQTVRPWTSVEGEVLAEGKLIKLAYEQVYLETASGEQRTVPVSQLSEGDLGYLSQNWGLPKECLIEQVAYTPRSWTPLTMTWKASNLCHKPLYFQEVNLERYGHTAGPWLQPVVSSAHFFANIAVLPYKMGMHPPHECQYALGYYRPGNCAPWIVPPVPISAQGALSQAAFMTGAFWLVP
jgi:hypothetical protein